MINAILRFSVERRFLTLSLILVLVGVGVWSFQRLPIDAVPDITNVQVQINTEAPGYSPLEAEQRIPGPCPATACPRSRWCSRKARTSISPAT